MTDGTVTQIFIATEASGAMTSLDEVRAIEEKGLEGDRYAARSGTWSPKTAPGREVTLVESEAVDAMRNDYFIDLEDGATRRNIVTTGVALNHLVGQEFLVGDVRLKGVRLCEPCAHLGRLTQKGVIKALIHRGGLRADIVEGGTIRVGDHIRPA